MANNDLIKQFRAIAEEIKSSARDVLEVTVDEVAGDALSHIKGIGDYEKHRKAKNYRKNFYLKKTSSNLEVSSTLANKQYQLTHLLEDGHEIWNQYGQYQGKTKQYPHWKETEEIAVKEFADKLYDRLGRLQ